MPTEPNRLSQEHYQLIRAAYHGNLEDLNLLLNEGVDLELKNLSGLTALHFAASVGHASIVRRLIEAGADTNTRTTAGHTAKELARLNGWEDVAALFSALENPKAPL